MIALLSMVATAAQAGAAGVAPTYLRTIGHPSHAVVYPSGLDVDSSGNIYVADTGNDQVVAYRPDGSQIWRVGTRGNKGVGRFSNPRDTAYIAGKVYVADTGFNRVDVLNASDGSWVTAWGTRFISAIGISKGNLPNGTPVVLVTDDQQNAVFEFTTGGTLIRTIQRPLGTGQGDFNAPRDAATDSAGNIYVADYANDRVVKLSPTGGWLMSWGSHASAHGQFLRPYGVAVDASNRIYVADSDNERIQKFTSSGGYLQTYGSTGTGNGQFQQLRRVAVGAGTSPMVYGADLWDDHIDRFTQAGAFSKRYGGGPAPVGGFNEPSGIAVDTNTFVADSVNQRIERFTTSTGAYDLTWGDRGWGANDLSGFNWPRDVTINETSKTVWVADTKNNRVTQFTRSGTATGKTFGVAGSAVGDLHWPWAVASSGGNVVVADTWNSRVQLWDTSRLTPAWTQTGFNFPKDVAVEGATVYVADTMNNRVVELNASTGAVLKTISGITDPEGIAVTPAGTIWVAEAGQNRLVEISAAGAVVQTFGKLGSATGQFFHPTHLEIYSGDLYVTDSWNDRIQVFKLNDA
ncbi:MAG TPA: NHL repeat-containing protein [Gaiellales bacterium]|nr:NHL repeat-containing protein [Gaiellales bacterium]